MADGHYTIEIPPQDIREFRGISLSPPQFIRLVLNDRRYILGDINRDQLDEFYSEFEREISGRKP